MARTAAITTKIVMHTLLQYMCMIANYLQFPYSAAVLVSRDASLSDMRLRGGPNAAFTPAFIPWQITSKDYITQPPSALSRLTLSPLPQQMYQQHITDNLRSWVIHWADRGLHQLISL